MSFLINVLRVPRGVLFCSWRFKKKLSSGLLVDVIISSRGNFGRVLMSVGRAGGLCSHLVTKGSARLSSDS